MYEVIVLGATFAAAGIAHRYKKKCLILEESLQGGNEFYGALQYGTAFKKMPVESEAIAFREAFLSADLYSRITQIYPYLQEADVLFQTRIVSVEKCEKRFLCTAHGIEGFCTFEAKKVIDTRAYESISLSKTYNILIESDEIPSFEGCIVEQGGMECHFVIRLPIPLHHGFSEARKEVKKLVEGFSARQQLILSAATFDYQIKTDLPEERECIRLLPSKASDNPILAFSKGLEVVL